MNIGGRLFKPAAVVTISGQTVTNIDGKGLRIAFNVQRSLNSSPDTATVAVYGLAPERTAAMQSLFDELGTSQVTLSTGYDGVPVRTFSGSVRRMRGRVRRGADLSMEVDADDGGEALRDVTLSGSTGALSSAGMTAGVMITVALAAMANAGHPIQQHPSVAVALASATPASTASIFGAVSIGSVRALIDQAARVLGVRWWLNDGFLYMARRNLPTDPIAVRLPRTHWLSEFAQDGSGLSRLSTLLDPNIVPGRLLQIETDIPRVFADYRCEALGARGDTRSGPWTADLVLRRTEILPT
jgi:hypothetical protein